MTDSDQYWYGFAEKYLTLSIQMGRPTFFLTITMNPDWPDYEALKRGSWDFSDVTVISLVFWNRLKLFMKYCKTAMLFAI
jgi:hypothetical protein